jgi:DUF4097 and DUF4098 domain-containing protein YvlB
MRAKLAFSVLIACLAGLAGCEWEDFGAPRYSKDFHYSYPLQSGGKLSLETFNGAVEVTGWDQQTVEIDGVKYGPTPEAADAIRIEITHSSTAIEIHVDRPYDLRGNLGARFSLKMPRKAILDRVASSNGPIVVQGATGPARLRTSNGSIRVENFEESLDAHTSNGGIELADVRGEAVASTTNGRIHAENLKGPLDATSSNGSITADLTGSRLSRPVRLETSNASVDLTLPAGFENGARVSTNNGPITIRMPAGSNARVLARTNNSSISSDFETKVQGVVNKNNLDGAIGGGAGGPLLDLSTSNAPIRLLRL